jgi:hypothetical protein
MQLKRDLLGADLRGWVSLALRKSGDSETISFEASGYTPGQFVRMSIDGVCGKRGL